MTDPSLLDCALCPRLAAFLQQARLDHPDWHCRPVPPHGDPAARVLVVGLAPGFRGANRTGRPFCGDQSGHWLYRALFETGFASSPDPLTAGGELSGLCITNAVKCVPPENKPTTTEILACRARWLDSELAASEAAVLIALGNIAHSSMVAMHLGAAGKGTAGAFPFAHGATHRLHLGGKDRILLDSFHPSPLNTRTGRLSWEAFLGLFERARQLSLSPIGPS